MERLPDAELEVMQALWRQEKYPVSSAALMEELGGEAGGSDRPPCIKPPPPGLEEVRGFVEDGRKEGR